MLEALRTVRRLTDEGMKRELAEALVEEINAGMKDNLVTKSDLKTELALLRADSKSDMSEFRTEVKEAFADFKTAITTRVAFMMVAQLFALAGLAMYLKHG